MMLDESELEKRFRHHAPDADRAERHVGIRMMAEKFAEFVDNYCLDGREKALAVTKIEEAMMWANAAIAREGVGGGQEG